MNEYIKNRQLEIIEFRPKTFSFDFLTKIEKIQTEYNSTSSKNLTLEEVEQIKQYNSFQTLDKLIDTESLLYELYNQIEEFFCLSKDEKIQLQNIIENYGKQIKNVIEIYKLNNFETQYLDYYSVKKKAEDFIDKLEEILKGTNSSFIYYPAINNNLKINKMLMEFCSNKIYYYYSILKIKDIEKQNPNVYKYNEEEKELLNDFSNLLQENYIDETQKLRTFSKERKINQFLQNGYLFRNKFITYNKPISQRKPSQFKKQQGQLAFCFDSKLLLFLRDFYKYNHSERKQMDQYLSILNERVSLYQKL